MIWKLTAVIYISSTVTVRVHVQRSEVESLYMYVYVDQSVSPLFSKWSPFRVVSIMLSYIVHVDPNAYLRDERGKLVIFSISPFLRELVSRKGLAGVFEQHNNFAHTLANTKLTKK